MLRISVQTHFFLYKACKRLAKGLRGLKLVKVYKESLYTLTYLYIYYLASHRPVSSLRLIGKPFTSLEETAAFLLLFDDFTKFIIFWTILKYHGDCINYGYVPLHNPYLRTKLIQVWYLKEILFKLNYR